MTHTDYLDLPAAHHAQHEDSVGVQLGDVAHGALAHAATPWFSGSETVSRESTGVVRLMAAWISSCLGNTLCRPPGRQM